MSHSWRSTGLLHARLLYASPTPGACSNSCPASQWCHPTILSSAAPFSFYLQSFPASGYFPESVFCNPMNRSTPGLPVHHQLRESTQPMSIESVMPSNHLILCRPLLLLPSIFPSIRVFYKELVLRIRWPKYWSLSFNISPSNEYSGLISFRMDLLDLLAFQGTLKSLHQHHSSKVSILQHSASFIVQLSHPYMTTGKTIALTRWTFVSKVIALLFNMLSRLVIALLPRSKCLNYMTAVTICSDFGAQENKRLPWWLSGKESACQAGDMGSIPWSGRSPGEGNGNSLQYSCLGNPMDREDWQAIVYAVAEESDTT